MYILVLKNSHQIVVSLLYGFPFRDSRYYIWCCKELLNGMICLISSSQVAVISMTNFSCLLMMNFQYTVFFLNIFYTEVMAVNA